MPAVLGAAGFVAVVGLVPILGDGEGIRHVLAYTSAYALVLLPRRNTPLRPPRALAADLPAQRALLLGAVAGLLGGGVAFLGGRPDALTDGPAAPHPLHCCRPIPRPATPR